MNRNENTIESCFFRNHDLMILGIFIVIYTTHHPYNEERQVFVHQTCPQIGLRQLLCCLWSAGDGFDSVRTLSHAGKEGGHRQDVDSVR